MTFYEAYVTARMRKLYPSGEIQFQRSPYGNFYDVLLHIPERDLVSLSRQDTAEAARYLDNEIFPARQRPIKHWSLFRKGRR